MNTERTPLFYMANLGAEVSRLYAAKEKTAPLARCLNIIEQYIQVEVYPWRKREIAILKDVVEDIATGGNKYDISAEELEEYFLPFALRLQS